MYTSRGIITRFIESAVLFTCVSIFVYALIFHGTGPASIVVAILLSLFIYPLCFIIFYTTSFSFDRIYENGIESCRHTIIDRMRGNVFHRYDEISLLGYGEKLFNSGVTRRFVLIYTNNKEKRETGFVETDAYPCKNGFFDVLLETLQEKCPDIEWVDATWDDFPYFT